MIEEEYFPSISELWERLTQRLDAFTREMPVPDRPTDEEALLFCQEVWTAIFHLTCGAMGAMIYLENLSAPHRWEASERFLEGTARYFPDIIVALEAHVDAWRDRFWASGGHPTQYDAFRDALADMIMGGFRCKDSRAASEPHNSG
jgi:hypothetical protein